jgi:hypothetical protein
MREWAHRDFLFRPVAALLQRASPIMPLFRIGEGFVRFLLRLLGYLLIAAGFVALVIDGARSIANSIPVFTPLGDVLAALLRERYLQIQPLIVRNLHPLLWDPVVITLLRAPAELVAMLLGFLLLRLGRRPDAPIGIVTRR